MLGRSRHSRVLPTDTRSPRARSEARSPLTSACSRRRRASSTSRRSGGSSSASRPPPPPAASSPTASTSALAAAGGRDARSDASGVPTFDLSVAGTAGHYWWCGDRRRRPSVPPLARRRSRARCVEGIRPVEQPPRAPPRRRAGGRPPRRAEGTARCARRAGRAARLPGHGRRAGHRLTRGAATSSLDWAGSLSQLSRESRSECPAASCVRARAMVCRFALAFGAG
jgi:hypothetical protein